MDGINGQSRLPTLLHASVFFAHRKHVASGVAVDGPTAIAGRYKPIILAFLWRFGQSVRRIGNAFDNDRLARQLCRGAMQRGQDLELPPVQRAFLYMPLQHSEKLADQDLSVECYQQLSATTDGVLGDFLGSFLQSARDHRDIIARFGRFPHRNKALKRASSPDELAYLEGGPRFGQ